LINSCADAQARSNPPSWSDSAGNHPCPLAHEDFGRLIADSLQSEPERVAPLAQPIHDKTAGNPFFAISIYFWAC
jgi:hypothetical protein